MKPERECLRHRKRKGNFEEEDINGGQSERAKKI